MWCVIYDSYHFRTQFSAKISGDLQAKNGKQCEKKGDVFYFCSGMRAVLLSGGRLMV
jgi:hypothetical protein